MARTQRGPVSDGGGDAPRVPKATRDSKGRWQKGGSGNPDALQKAGTPSHNPDGPRQSEAYRFGVVTREMARLAAENPNLVPALLSNLTQRALDNKSAKLGDQVRATEFITSLINRDAPTAGRGRVTPEQVEAIADDLRRQYEREVQRSERRAAAESTPDNDRAVSVAAAVARAVNEAMDALLSRVVDEAGRVTIEMDML